MGKAMAALVAACVWIPSDAWAQVPCGPRQAMLDGLARGFAERPVARALTDDGRMLELLASPDGATWTAILSGADGRACVVGAGRHFDLLAPMDPDDNGA